jgi:hypothetical protein
MSQHCTASIAVKCSKWLLLLAASLLAVSIHAEQVYVSDKLVVNLTDQASSEGQRVTTVETGDVLEVLERVDGYIRVRTEKGNEGWLKSGYAITQIPAARRLKELESQGTSGGAAENAASIAKHKQEISQLQERNKGLESEIAALKSNANKAAADLAQAAPQPNSAPPSDVAITVATEAPVTEFATATSIHSNRWSPKVLVLMGLTYLVVGGLGFLWGYRVLSAKIKRKYGRVRIY